MSTPDQLPVRRQAQKTLLVLLAVGAVVALVIGGIMWAGVALPHWQTVWNPHH